MTQAEALEILKSGANVFLTGEPGSGKTHTINQYVAYLRSCGIEPAITASTGIAATHVGGLTVHSWSGIGIRHTLTKQDIDRIKQNRSVVRRVDNAQVLIIDEVSMLSARTFSMVEAVCRDIRRDPRPFGGLQIVLVGDFFQLPPVSRRNSDDEPERLSLETQQEQFAFFSPAWNTLSPLVCYLSEQHRQEDALFLEFLSAIRSATVVESHRQLLRTRYSPKPREGTTQLYNHNADVDRINNEQLAKLAGAVKVFEMESRGPEKLVASLKRSCLSPEILSLKIGARIMFTKNDVTTHRYVNGTLGVVTGFDSMGHPIVKTHSGKMLYTEHDEWHIEESGRILARIIQIPLRLAWAMTVHKSQGMSLDAVHMDLSDTFEYGQGYVALSRVRTLAGLSLAGLNTRALEVHPEILAKDAEFRRQSDQTRERFSALPHAERVALQAAFIHACGGKLGMGRRSVTSQKDTVSTYEKTRALVAQKLSLKEMAQERKVTIGTIISHLEKLVADKAIDPVRDLAHIERDPVRFEEMKKVLKKVFAEEGTMPLSPARAILGETYGYDELQLARLFLSPQE